MCSSDLTSAVNLYGGNGRNCADVKRLPVLSAHRHIDPHLRFRQLDIWENIKGKWDFSFTADAYVFFVADQPWLSERTLEAFLKFMRKVSDEDREGSPIGCVSRLGEPGNPVWFSAFYNDELLALSGDRGGKRVMKAHMDQVHFFEVEEERELWDVDTLEDQAGR